MDVIWINEKAFFKEIIEELPEPKPANTTVATLLKRMQDKEFVGYELFGNSRQYFPLVNKTDYFTKYMKEVVQNYFNDSALQFASFFTQSSKMTKEELEDLKSIIDNELKKKEK